MNGPPTVGSLFAGVGGFDLGLERAGMRTAWQVELDPFCRRVLERHFPDAERYEDVCEVGADDLAPVDLICGGFPCQDISLAGRGAGIDGERSGLWSEMWRVIRELGPRWVVVENVPALTSRGLDRVLRDLAACGYDAEWDCLPASAFGAPHRRDRIWVVAYAREERRKRGAGEQGTRRKASERGQAGNHVGDCGRVSVADPNGERLQAEPLQRHLADGFAASGDESAGAATGWWAVEPPVGRVADGVPDRLDRLSALGNALVPQVAEWIGRRIIEWERVNA